MAKEQLTRETKIWFLKKIVNHVFEVDFKPMLEMDEEIADLYDSGILTNQDFYKAVS